MSRIVFASHGEVSALARVPGAPKPLGKAKTGVWMAIADDVLTAAWTLGVKLELLWLSQAAYAHAVRKLDDKETAKAVERRREHYTPAAVDQAVTWLGMSVRRSIGLAAKDKKKEHVERCLAQLVVLETEGRYDMLSQRERMFGVIEGETLLRAELQDLRPDRKDELAARDQFYLDEAREMDALGHKRLVEAPLRVPLTRVYAVTPGKGSERFFRDREDPQIAWKDAIVGPIALHDRPRWLEAKKKLRLVYPSRGGLYAALELTPAQQAVELEERVKDPRPDEHLHVLRVELGVRKRALAGKVPATAAALLRKQIPIETDLLVAALVEKPGFGAESGPDLAAEERQRVVDARFLSALAQRGGRGELALELAGYATLAERDAKAI